MKLKILNPEANKSGLEKERLAKVLYQKRKLEEVKKTKETNTKIASPMTTFSNTAIKARSLKRAAVAAALPRSPSKKVEIVQSLAKQFNLKIQYSSKAKVGRPCNDLAEIEINWLKDFFDRPDITYTTPGMKDQKYIGKVNGESLFAQKRYLLWSMQDILGILNLGSNEGGESFNRKFSRDYFSSTVWIHNEPASASLQ